MNNFAPIQKKHGKKRRLRINTLLTDGRRRGGGQGLPHSRSYGRNPVMQSMSCSRGRAG